MKHLIRLMHKNLKLLVRSKASALVVIIAPLVIMLLIGLAYSNTKSIGLTIGVYTSDFEQARPLLDALQEKDFRIVKYNSTERCVKDIKSGYTHTCLRLPDDLNFADNKPKEITFHVDESKLNLVFVITDTLNKKVQLKSSELSKGLAENVVASLNNAQSTVSSQKTTIDDSKAKTAGGATATDTATTELAALDASVEGLDAPNTTVVSEIKTFVEKNLTAAKDKVKTAKDKVNGLSVNQSQKDEIVPLLNDVSSVVDDVKNKFGSNGSYAQVESIITTLQNNLDTAKTKLQAVQEKRATIGTQLGDVKASLVATQANLDALQTALDGVVSNIDGVQVKDPTTIATPLITKIEPIVSKKTYLNYLFPTLMVLVVMFVSLLLGTTLVMMEKHNLAFFRNFLAPVRKFTYVASTYLTVILILLLQIVIVIGIALSFFDWQPLEAIPFALLTLFLTASIFAFAGMVIGYLFTSEDTGILATVSMGSLLLFFSGVILPLESIPGLIREVTAFNPFVVAEKLLREVFLFDMQFSGLMDDLLLLASYFVFLFVLTLVTESLMGKQFLHKLMYKHHKKVEQKRKQLGK